MFSYLYDVWSTERLFKKQQLKVSVLNFNLKHLRASNCAVDNMIDRFSYCYS